MQTATAQSFIPVKTNIPDVREEGLNERMTRYGVRFIRDTVDLSPRDFLRHSLEPNRFHNFMVFRYPVPSETGKRDGIGEFIDRLPAHQMKDLTGKGFVDLREIAELDNEDEAVRIFDHLTNPNLCSKYPFDLGSSCVTCWRDHLRSDAFQVGDFSDLSAVGLLALRATHERLLKAMDDALIDARAVVNQAASDIDNANSAKTDYDPFDYVCIRHTHSAMPTYKTANPQANFAEVLGAALRGKGEAKQEEDNAVALKLAELDKAMQEVAELKARLEQAALPKEGEAATDQAAQKKK